MCRIARLFSKTQLVLSKFEKINFCFLFICDAIMLEKIVALKIKQNAL